ncbi:MAG: hypothetical protein QM750_11290 [Rubrivivax sp.]
MAENESFFRKVVRFVANPATDWNELNSRRDEAREMELEKSELKAMIERKRRNDFVRKREFDMLRKVRREGLSPEQLAALGSSSKLDDSEVRLVDGDSKSSRTDVVKAKIDEIEQQMTGETSGFMPASAPPAAARKPVYFDPHPARPPAPPPPRASAASSITPDIDLGAELVDDGERLPALPPLPDDTPLPPPRSAPPAAQMAGGLPPLAPRSVPATTIDTVDFNSPLALEVSEVMHDPDLDEPVIAFANADFDACEQALQRVTHAGGARHDHAETWLVLFDLYRATGQQPRFESLAIDYAQRFGWSAPQWYSLPKQVADAVAEEKPMRGARGGEAVGWTAPAELDVDAVARLRSQTLQMPLPWVFDWGPLQRVDTDAAMQLSTLFRLWAGQSLEMRWIAGERLFTVLQEAAPSGVKDADPAFWLTRLDALRLVNRVDQFDETAIDYCVTYEVSPPSWEPTRCNVRISASALSTRQPQSSVLTEPSTGFVESSLLEDTAAADGVAALELSGQLVGDISGTLSALNEDIGTASTISVSCTRLIRVDFIAAGDLLNWVLGKKSENRAVHFVDAHRLVALFFGAMGINEHAKVQVRKN